MKSKNHDTSSPGSSSSSGGLTDEELIQLYRDMVKVREFEDRVKLAFLENLVHGTTHLCQGQEAISVGVLKALHDNDYLTYTYRGHGVCIARGMSMETTYAEIFGRESGVSKGLGGSMHLTDQSLNLIGSFGIVGGGLPVACGAALSAQLDGQGQVSVTFFGDGATNIGAFHETLNMAAVWKLPVIFVCENNLYGEFSRINRTTPIEDLAIRATAYAMPGVTVDGNDVLAVYEAARNAVQRARNGEGPTLLECKTYRYSGHSRTDPGKYRPAKEVEEWLARDPLPSFQQILEQKKVLTRLKAEEIITEMRLTASDAAAAAAEAPWPPLRDYTPETYVK